MVRKTYSHDQQLNRTGWIFMIPALLVTALIIVYPIVYTFYLSVTNTDLMNPDRAISFVGLKNFIYLFTDPDFYKALFNNIFMTVFSVAIQLVLGMIGAMLLNMSFHGRGLLRGVFILPWATPTFVAAFTWLWLMDPQTGLINIILENIGVIQEGIPFFTSSKLAIFSTIIAYVWKGLPWVILVLLSGLQMVPTEMREAARVDGANAWQEFRNVTLPSMHTIILITVVLRTIWTFNWFDYLYLLTGGGPMNATMTWPIQVYNTAFTAFKLGRASALGVIIFFFMAIFAFVYFKVLAREGDDL